MILVFAAPIVFLVLCVGFYIFDDSADKNLIRIGRLRIEWEPKFGMIRLDSPCPACGHRGCELGWNKDTKKVIRACKTCGCPITQPPILPSLFEEKK